ncbi:hypothetical protein [Marinobacter sp. ANT_B65]|uniref:hypothetical protein n=1 Tax=Marinobacter sp. ANT_B65 TaxID=2039467 RepID=UPI000BBE72F0|nr:hypothetical protein [Marinobacter sp. ANT_B65]PCM45388.1 hypothetical protein CPA50_05110 [Marinobacter sp. ANT_B65]
MSNARMKLHSEQYGKSGNIGENFRKLLGSPTLDPLQTVIRESVQNVLDAAKLGKPPEVLIRLRRLSRGQMDTMASDVFGDLPEEGSSRERIAGFLDTDSPLVLEICDFGTTGLGGPTRSDQIPVGTTRTDFIDFLRNIGSSRDTDHGGGTYGFGKVSLYAMSSCNTILVDSYVHGDEEKYRRFMGCHVGRSFDVERDSYLQRYTGRHWWGELSPDGDFAEPLTNEDAGNLALSLGFCERTKNRTGTSIMVLGLDVRNDEGADDPPELVGAKIVETLLWNFWPRMMGSTPTSRKLTCNVEVHGVFLEIPAPERFPPLDLFCMAMDKIRSGENADVAMISSQRPVQDLGMLAIQKGLKAKRTRLVEAESLFPESASHIAVMRPVELVVRYFQGDSLPDERLEWAGVFVVNDDNEVEQAFADAEPPAHDDWIPENLPKGHAKTFVNVALREIKKAAREVAAESMAPNPQGESGPSLAKVAGDIGAILDKGAGDGAGRRQAVSGKSKTAPRRARATRPVFGKLLDGYGSHLGPVAVFLSEVVQDVNKSGVRLKGDAMFAIDGSSIAAGKNITEKPKILEFRFEGVSGVVKVDAFGVDINGEAGFVEVLVAMPKQAAVTVNLEIACRGDE